MIAANDNKDNGGYRFRERENEFDFRHGLRPLPTPLKPAPETAPARSKNRSAVSAPDRIGMTLMLILAGMIGVGMIIASSWMTTIQFDINRISKSTAEVYSEIEKLSVKIERGTSISVIEHRATNELGMIYPAAEQVVYLEKEPAPINDFAQYIKENTYLIW